MTLVGPNLSGEPDLTTEPAHEELVLSGDSALEKRRHLMHGLGMRALFVSGHRDASNVPVRDFIATANEINLLHPELPPVGPHDIKAAVLQDPLNT